MTFRLGLPLLAASLWAMPFFTVNAAEEVRERVSGPIVHENVAVYFVHGTSAPGPVPQTLQEALSKGTVEVLETGNVQELKIRNTGDEPVFVQFGDIVKGGQQDRVLTVSMVLAPKSDLIPIGAYCVEQGRWATRGKEDARRFALSDSVMPSREAKIAMAKPARSPAAEPNVVAAGAPRIITNSRPIQQNADGTQTVERQQRTARLPESPSPQSEIWRSVGVVQDRLTSALAAPVTSEKSRTSLQLALEHESLKKAQDGYLAALEPAGSKDSDIVGVVVAVNGKLSSADVYPSNGLFRKMWPKLARAAATEALSGKAKLAADKPSDSAAVELPAVDAVTAFLADAEKGNASERVIANLAKLESRENDRALRVEARSASGAFVHRNYLAK